MINLERERERERERDCQCSRPKLFIIYVYFAGDARDRNLNFLCLQSTHKYSWFILEKHSYVAVNTGVQLHKISHLNMSYYGCNDNVLFIYVLFFQLERVAF